MTSKKYEFSKVKPEWDSSKYTNPYNCQNILEFQFDFPTHYYEGDYVNSFYTDRVPHNKMESAFQGTSLHWRFDQWITKSKSDVLKFLSSLIGTEVTGFRLVRFTNASSGYPVHRMDVWAQGEGNPSPDSFRPNYDLPELIEFDCLGIAYDKHGRIIATRE